MEKTSIFGLIIGVLAVLGGMHFKHVPFENLANPGAIFIIILGTVGAVLMATPSNEMAKIGKLFRIVFTKNKFLTPLEAVEKYAGFSEEARQRGILALEQHLDEETDSFVIHGLQLLLDGTDSDGIEESLTQDIAAMDARHEAGAQIFVQAGSYAPTLGVLGAVLGLIAALSNLDDTDILGEAIAAAFIATLLGIFTGYVLWHPMGNKLKRKSKQERMVRIIIMEGTLGICNGMNPRILRDNLLSYVSKEERAAANAKAKGGPGGKNGDAYDDEPFDDDNYH